ncbi:MAG: hypothetical protein ACRDOE_24980, partial [Streptosporangiaceae bacterium]
VHYWLDEVEEVFGQTLRTTYVETDTYQRVRDSWKMIAMQVTVVPRDLEPITVSSAGWPALVGDYRYSDKAISRYQVFLRDGTLYGGRDAQSATRLIPLAPLVFFQQGSIHIMVFVQDRSGAVTEVRELHKYNEVRNEADRGFGVAAAARAVVPPRVNSNLSSHTRGRRLSAGANFHFLAAALARRAKYLLEPAVCRVSPTTLPERSTVTRTVTLIWPRIDSRALRGTVGVS